MYVLDYHRGSCKSSDAIAAHLAVLKRAPETEVGQQGADQ